MNDLRVYQSGNLVAVITDLIDINHKKYLNGGQTLNFICVEQALKTEYLTVGAQILIDGQTYDIRYIDVSHASTGVVTYTVECEHVSYRLIDTKFDYFTDNDTPLSILNGILTGTGFIVGAMDYTSVVLFAVSESTNAMQLLISLANQLGGKLVFTNNGFLVSILNQINQNNGAQISIKKNLKGINKIIDDRGDDLTVAYRVDFIDLEQSNTYKDVGLVNFDVVDVGDNVRIIDDVIGVSITAMIISMNYNPILKRSVTVEISNAIDDITTWTAKVNAKNVKQGQSIYGTKIDNINGITVERDDKLARSIFNADMFKMQKGNGAGVYTDSLYFDPILEKYIFVGELIASTITGGTISGGAITGGTITGTTISGGEINIGITSKVKIFNYSNDGQIWFTNSSDILTSSIKGGGISGYSLFLNADDGGEVRIRTDGVLSLIGSTTVNISGTDINFIGSNRPEVNGSIIALYSEITWANLPDKPFLPTTTYFENDHNHGIPDGTQFLDINGTVRTWVASGGHSHLLTY